MFTGECNLKGNHSLEFRTRNNTTNTRGGVADLDIFTHTIHELQQQLNDDNKETYIMGDMNIDLLQYENHQKINEYLDNIFSADRTAGGPQSQSGRSASR